MARESHLLMKKFAYIYCRQGCPDDKPPPMGPPPLNPLPASGLIFFISIICSIRFWSIRAWRSDISFCKLTAFWVSRFFLANIPWVDFFKWISMKMAHRHIFSSKRYEPYSCNIRVSLDIVAWPNILGFADYLIPNKRDAINPKYRGTAANRAFHKPSRGG